MVYKNFIDYRKKLLQLDFLKLKSVSEKHCKLQIKKHVLYVYWVVLESSLWWK